MIKSIGCFLLLTLISINTSFAQGGTNILDIKATLGSLSAATISSSGGMGIWAPAKVEDKTITGTNYLFKSFEGLYVVTNKSGNSFKLLNLNYNLTHGTLETKISKDSVFQYDLKEIEYVIAGNKKYRNLKESILEGLFLEVFKGNTFDLYKKIDVSVLEGTINPMTQEKIQQDKYVQSYTYYTKMGDNIEKIKFNKGAILKLTKDKQGQVKEYAKVNNLDFSNDTDVNIILKYYESL